MGGYPAGYYIMPDHVVRLSTDRKKISIMQPLPGAKKGDINVEVNENGFCLDFTPEGKDPVHRCYVVGYDIDPATAESALKDGVLTIKASLAEKHMGKKVAVN